MTTKQILFIKTIATDVSLYFPFVPTDVAYFIGCQSALESHYGLSDLANVAHNFFGMKLPKRRVNLAHSFYRDYAAYYSRKQSVLDLLLWVTSQGDKYNLLSIDGYIDLLLSHGYAEDKQYIDKITSIYSQFKSIQK